jgi:hypothetical protein
MMADRTTKFLLFCIALALWGLLMGPTFTPIPAKAAGSDGGQLVVVGEGQAARVFLFTPGGRLYRFSSNDLSVQAQAVFDPAKETYVNHAP